jgi:hypothetical protein
MMPAMIWIIKLMIVGDIERLLPQSLSEQAPFSALAA